MNETDDLKKWVQKAAAGDKTAFEELYRATCRSVYFTCLSFLKDEQEAQDITQDVYLTAFEQLETLEDAGKFKTWLYRMAANKCINCLKKKQPVLPGDEQLQDMETEENENFLPEEYALNADKRELVLDITRKVCSDAQYQTILLYYYNELSIAEIAEIMECQENNVKKRLSIARAKIREGVLRYEKKSGDKLYSVAVIPFLTALFTAQMQDMQMPVLPLRFPGARPKSTAATQTAKANVAKTGGRFVLKGLQLKIAVAIAAVAVVGGVAAAVTITNQRAKEASVGAQGESAWDVADAGDSEDMDTSPETDIDGTQSDGDALQGEADTADGSDTSDESEGTEKAETKATGTDGKTTTPGEAETAEETEPTENANQTSSEQAAKPEYTYTDMSATMYATQTVNVRTLPSTDGEKVGSLSTNQEVNITGQCNETSWYRFEYNGQTAYVSNNYVSDSKIEVAAAAPAGSTEAAPAQETAGASTSSGVPAGVLDLTTLPREQWIDRGDWLVYVHGVWDEYPPIGDIGPLMSSFNERNPAAEVSGGGCRFMKDLGICYSTVHFTNESFSPEFYATNAYYAKYATKRN